MVTLTATRTSLALDSLIFLAYLVRDGMNEKKKTRKPGKHSKICAEHLVSSENTLKSSVF